MQNISTTGQRWLKKVNNPQIQSRGAPRRNVSQGIPTKQHKSINDNKFKSAKLNCIHINADTLTNKLSELQFLLKDKNPDIVGISEVLPKNFKNDIHPEYFNMEGYTMETNINDTNKKLVRGCIMYIKNGLDYKTIDIDVQPQKFEEYISSVFYPAPRAPVICTPCLQISRVIFASAGMKLYFEPVLKNLRER